MTAGIGFAVSGSNTHKASPTAGQSTMEVEH
jgi:hypothetical protein